MQTNNIDISRFANIAKAVTITSFGIAIIHFFTEAFSKEHYIHLYYLILYLTGLSVCLILFFKSAGYSSKFASVLCNSKKSKFDCNNVIIPKHAYIYADISWADAGVIYFLTMTITSLFPFETNHFFHISLSAATLPFIIYSIYYQIVVAKSFCILCLMVQFVFCCQIILSAHYVSNHHIIPDTEDLMGITTLAVCGASMVLGLKYLLKRVAEYSAIKKQYTEFKYSVAKEQMLVQQILHQRAALPYSIVYNPNNAIALTYIFRLGCIPCVYHLSKIIHLIETRNDISVELIFNFDTANIKKELPIALYLYTIYKEDSQLFLKKLKEYIELYPLSKSLYANRWNNNVEIPEDIKKCIFENIKWCKNNGIEISPTILLNNQIVNPFYKLEDIVGIIAEQQGQSRNCV